ncbi:MAG: putative DNA binding domain-containing protein [Clostridiales Family XIII bacterium]|jgi:ATP-dependent DNA helicase RecG|nr:putative DNA binding domain-containing protein [Clostridiales Family XIII bacterium]
MARPLEIEGWNPNDTIHTICAYANDFNNTNGGYVVIGVEEKRGRPVLPPCGVDVNVIDKIQQEIFQYCNEIEPRYIPRIEIEERDGNYIIYLWCPAGDSGPYTAPNDVLSKDKENKFGDYWIKPASVKTKAKGDEIAELYDKFNSVPFDDRINRKATVDDISYGYLEEFISQSDSALLEVKKNMQKEDLLLSLEVADETDAGIDIRNIGILMFCDRPDKFIPGAQIEIVHFRTVDREAGDFTEMTYQGPIQEQIRRALGDITVIAVMEKVVKHDDRPEASRFFTYPLAAIEEALVNSVFHKSYKIPEPVEVRIYTDEIKILNYPGPDKDIDMEKLSKGLVIPRRYRNRRIGEFLKEIDLSEKRATGITKILSALEANGSPSPEFETNDDRSYMITTFKVHTGFNQNELPGISMYADNKSEGKAVNSGKIAVNSGNEKYDKILQYIREKGSISNAEGRELLELAESTTRKLLSAMVAEGYIESTGNYRDRRYLIVE